MKNERVILQGTASNARDLAAMVDAIDGVGSEINYWYTLSILVTTRRFPRLILWF
jgi:hypothetical protein